MIAYIEGKLFAARDKSCIILTPGGVGYELSLPAHTFAQLPAAGENISFFTSFLVREDAMELYGFATAEECQTFKILTAISRIGARTALAILSAYRPEELLRIVMEADTAALTRVAGIGQKTAQHILLELKYRLDSLKIGRETVEPATGKSPVFTDTLAAMLNLGYSEEECAATIREVLAAEPDLDASAAIRQTLKKLAKGKS